MHSYFGRFALGKFLVVLISFCTILNQHAALVQSHLLRPGKPYMASIQGIRFPVDPLGYITFYIIHDGCQFDGSSVRGALLMRVEG